MSEARVSELPAPLVGGTQAAECPAYVYATPPAYLAFVGGAAAAAAPGAAAASAEPGAGSKRPRPEAAGDAAAAAASAPVIAAGAPGEGGAEDAAVFPAPPFSLWLPESQVRTFLDGGGRLKWHHLRRDAPSDAARR